MISKIHNFIRKKYWFTAGIFKGKYLVSALTIACKSLKPYQNNPSISVIIKTCLHYATTRHQNLSNYISVEMLTNYQT